MGEYNDGTQAICSIGRPLSSIEPNGRQKPGAQLFCVPSTPSSSRTPDPPVLSSTYDFPPLSRTMPSQWRSSTAASQSKPDTETLMVIEEPDIKIEVAPWYAPWEQVEPTQLAKEALHVLE